EPERGSIQRARVMNGWSRGSHPHEPRTRGDEQHPAARRRGEKMGHDPSAKRVLLVDRAVGRVDLPELSRTPCHGPNPAIGNDRRLQKRPWRSPRYAEAPVLHTQAGETVEARNQEKWCLVRSPSVRAAAHRCGEQLATNPTQMRAAQQVPDAILATLEHLVAIQERRAD